MIQFITQSGPNILSLETMHWDFEYNIDGSICKGLSTFLLNIQIQTQQVLVFTIIL